MLAMEVVVVEPWIELLFPFEGGLIGTTRWPGLTIRARRLVSRWMRSPGRPTSLGRSAIDVRPIPIHVHQNVARRQRLLRPG